MDQQRSLSSSEIRSILDADVPEGVQRELLCIIREQYRATHEFVKSEYEGPERRDVEPQIRRANIERAIHVELPERCPGLVEVKPGMTTKNGNSFRYMRCGPIVMTQSYVERGRKVPRKAAFRNGFASHDLDAMMLFPDDEEKRQAILSAIDSIYVIVVHEPNEDDRGAPDRVALVAVGDDCQPICSIDLIKKFGTTEQAAETEKVKDLVPTKLTSNAIRMKQQKTRMEEQA